MKYWHLSIVQCIKHYSQETLIEPIHCTATQGHNCKLYSTYNLRDTNRMGVSQMQIMCQETKMRRRSSKSEWKLHSICYKGKLKGCEKYTGDGWVKEELEMWHKPLQRKALLIIQNKTQGLQVNLKVYAHKQYIPATNNYYFTVNQATKQLYNIRYAIK